MRAQIPYYVKRSFVAMPKVVKAGKPFVVELKGVGWTQLDNTVAVTYDNAYIGYACGFNSNGYVRIQLATGKPGTHLIDLYPLLYTQQPAYPYPHWDGAAAQLRAGRTGPGGRLPAAGVPARDQGRRVVPLVREAPCASPGEPPVPAAEHGHEGRHEECTHDRRVDENAEREAQPELFETDTRPATKPANAATMISAAAVMTPPVCSRPSATARALSPVRSHASRIRVTRKTS